MTQNRKKYLEQTKS